MIYESEIEEKTLEDNFYKRMALYLNSKSIDEYYVQRDVLNIKDSRIDEFWLWYMYKEKKHVLIGYWLLCMIGISALTLFAPPLILGGGYWWAASIYRLQAYLFSCTLVLHAVCLNMSNNLGISKSHTAYLKIEMNLKMLIDQCLIS